MSLRIPSPHETRRRIGPLRRGLALALLVATSGAASAQPQPCRALADRTPHSVARLHWLGTVDLRRGDPGRPDHFGGISGIDFDPDSGQWALVSDDKAEHGPGRYYPARIAFDLRGFQSIALLPPVALPLPDQEVPDAEALRVLPCTGLLAWSTEGDAAHGHPPSVRLMTPAGRPAGALSLPANLRFDGATGEGPGGARPNLNLEGLAPTPDGRSLWVAMEAPLVQDGPPPSLSHGAAVRFTRLSLVGGPATQWAYPVDPIPRAGTAGQRRADNGVSEVLALGNGELLVVERSGREVGPGAFDFNVRLYLAMPASAPPVPDDRPLPAAPGALMRKRHLLTLNDLDGPRVDNVEGAAWGPRLPDGRASLVLVSDDNFSAHQTTQFWLFAVEEP